MSKHSIDMSNGAILPKLIKFTVPILAMNILQLLYNAADIIIVGQFAGEAADLSVAAVGSTNALINLVLQVFIGLGVGVNVVTGQLIGAGRKNEVPEIIKTSVILALSTGVVMGAVGAVFSKTFLIWMSTPTDVLPYASRYLSIYFLGVPASLLYNFLSAVMRADGDTKRPLYFLTVSGLTNVIFNVIFVLLFNMNVDGVAWATVISQYLSAALVALTLLKEKGYLKLDFKNFKIYKDKLRLILQIGLPSGIYSSLFSVSNVIIQSAVNSFNNSVVVAGISAASNIEGFVWMGMNSVSVAATSFVSQNMGAGKVGRIKRTLFVSQGAMLTVWGIMSGAFYLMRNLLFSFYLPENAAAVEFGLVKFTCLIACYFLGGIMDVMTATLRGMGYSFSTTVISLIGTCALRAVWVFAVFNPVKQVMSISNSLFVLYLAYPISWSVTLIGLTVCFIIAIKKLSHIKSKIYK